MAIVHKEDNILLEALADKEQLAEALANIISNGWEAELTSGRKSPIQVTTKHERLWVSMTIRDEGNGIPKKVGKHIYDPFYSSKNSISNWGMGMYFAHQVIKNHMGTVRFESSPAGTTFLVLVPAFQRSARE